jgi:hypothetical protein
MRLTTFIRRGNTFTGRRAPEAAEKKFWYDSLIMPYHVAVSSDNTMGIGGLSFLPLSLSA